MQRKVMIKSNKKFCFFVVLSFLFLIISCKTKFDLRNEKDAAVQVVQDIQTKKIIFLGNNHNGAVPTFFLKENLKKFYDAGVRYLFLEGDNDNYISESEKFKAKIYPIWGHFGYNFEDIILYDEIIEINENHKEDPIIVVWPETGLVFTEEEWKDDTLTNSIRDKYIQEKIIETMDNTNSKAIIFYGDAHGVKKSEIWDSDSKDPYWLRLGYYLDNHYGNNFSTYYFYPYSTDKRKSVIYNDDYNNDFENKAKCKSLSEKNIELLLKTENAERDFNHYCLYENWIQTVPIYYLPTKEILKFLISLSSDSKMINDRQIDIWSKKSQQLFALYYLKYHFGNDFDYDYTDSNEQLYIALQNLQNKELINMPYDLEDLELYSFYLTDWISSYVCNHSEAINYINDDLDFYLNNLAKAQSLNSRDIWPQYWISYFRTEKAISSDKKKDYRKAMKEWEKLFKNDLFYASPIIKLAYQKMAFCAEKFGDKEKATIFQNEAEKVNPFLDIDFEYYQYFGW